ncbi:588_t:CDS:2, partial [Acaulospora colombiana]
KPHMLVRFSFDRVYGLVDTPAGRGPKFIRYSNNQYVLLQLLSDTRVVDPFVRIWPGSDIPHGSYDVYLDGTPSRFNASAAVTDSTIPLFKATGLPSIPHTISIHNTGSQG